MHGNLRVAVVIPCFNEESKIRDVINTMPEVVDRIYLIDDHSFDQSVTVAEEAATVADKEIVIVQHHMNRGVGAAIATGYKVANADGFDLVAVMAADGQMAPEDLEHLLGPVAAGAADYVKGNRFKGIVGDKIPWIRLFGNLILSALTKIVSGYWHVSDTQCGYTVINRAALASVNWDDIYPRYGCPNDILTRLNVAEMRVMEVGVQSRYGVDWTSKMKVRKVVVPIMMLMARLFLHRMFRKYIYISGHPIVLYYASSFLFAALTGLLFVYLLSKWVITGAIPTVALIMFGTTFGVSIQLLLSAFELDFQINRELCIHEPRGVNIRES